jgi:hypothetical protein
MSAFLPEQNWLFCFVLCMMHACLCTLPFFDSLETGNHVFLSGETPYDLGEFEATAHMHLHAFIRVVPDAKDAIAGNIETLYSLRVLLCILVTLLLLHLRDVCGQLASCV